MKQQFAQLLVMKKKLESHAKQKQWAVRHMCSSFRGLNQCCPSKGHRRLQKITKYERGDEMMWQKKGAKENQWSETLRETDRVPQSLLDRHKEN